MASNLCRNMHTENPLTTLICLSFSACHSLVENLKTESRRQRKASWFSIPNPEDRKNRKTDDQKITKNYQTTEKAKKHKTE